MSTKDNCQSNLGGLTDSDKAGESSMDTNNYFGRCSFLKKTCTLCSLYKRNYDNHCLGGLCMTEPENIAMVLEFLTLVCSEGRMRDWLGKEGRGFWLPLLSLLSNRPVENPSLSSLRWCHIDFIYLYYLRKIKKELDTKKDFYILQMFQNEYIIRVIRKCND